jgi:uncharacterized protein (DUF4415 family)
MRRRGATVSYTPEEIDAMLARGESRTDWVRVRGTSEADVARDVAADPDLAVPEDWEALARPGLPSPWPDRNKEKVSIRLDPEVVSFFRAQGRGWQSRVNALLRAYVESRQRR